MQDKIEKLLQGHPVEIKILMIVAVCGAFAAALTGVVNVFLGLGNFLLAVSLATGVVSLIVLYLVAVKRKYRGPAYFGMISLVLVLYPTMWFVNAGSHGPMIYFMLFNALFCAVLLPHLNHKVVMALQLVVVYSLLWYEHINPRVIIPYGDGITRSIDLALSFTIVFFIIFFMTVRIMSQYKKSINELEVTRKELMTTNDRLKVVSQTDALTGISNRRHIMNVLEQSVFQDGHDEVSLIMFDIDSFKGINDNYGHSVGDQVIKRVSKELSKSIRSTDAIGRIGGEEFLIVLPSMSLKDAYHKADVLREAVANLEWKEDNLRVTLSGGVYCRDGHETLDATLEKVDKKLYTSKNAGRNLISC